MDIDIRTTEVVIIGAGPAGATCANMLKEAGVDCILVDFQKFPREKVCGGGLTPKAWHLLNEIMPDFNYDYLAVKRMRLIVDGKANPDFFPSEELRTVKRADFDNALLQRYLQMGGVFIQDAFSNFEEDGNKGLLVALRSGKQIHCRYLVGADGANSRVRRELLGPYHGNILFLEQEVDIKDGVLEGELSARYNHGYYYRFPHKGCDIVGYGAKDASKEGFRHLLTDLGVKETKIKGAPIPVEVVESGRDDVILIGDAGGFANRLTYEGLYYALITGFNASIAIKKGIPFGEANKGISHRKRREKWIAELVYSPLGLWIVKACCLNNHFLKWIYDKGVSARGKVLRN